jgi:squalene-hopene/tetraprenyl-beta-curcumene cyclase
MTAVLIGITALLMVVGCESKQPEETWRAKTPLESLAKGLEFLFSHQKEDGSIVTDERGAEQAALGATALAVKGAARAPKDIREKYEGKIAKGCGYILKKQMTDGSFQGAEGLPTYTTALAIMALYNADAKKYSEQIKKGQEYLIGAQYYSEVDADDLNYGGWTYGADQKGKGEKANLSTSHYAMMALNETNLPEDHEVFKRAVYFLQRSQDSSETSDVKGIAFKNDGGFRYGPKDTRASEDKKGLVDEDGKEYYPSYASMTYAGFKSLLYANLDKNDRRVTAALTWMRNNYSLDKNIGMGYRKEEKGKMEQQGLYYFYNAFARALDAWGEKEFKDSSGASHFWAKELAEKLMEKQASDGSWINLEDRWHEGLKAVVTGYCIDALDTCIPWLEK